MKKKNIPLKHILKILCIDLIASIIYFLIAISLYDLHSFQAYVPFGDFIFFLFATSLISNGIIQITENNLPRSKALPLLLILAVFISICYFPLFKPFISSDTQDACIFAAAGVIFLLFVFAFLLQEHGKNSTCTVHAVAHVARSSNKRKIWPGMYRYPGSYFPVLEYWVDGKMIQSEANIGLTDPMPEGKIVPIYYNPEKPEEFRFQKPPFTQKAGSVVFIIIGIIFLLVAISKFKTGNN